MLKENTIKDIKKIQRDIKENKNNPQIYMKKLNNDFHIIAQDGYSFTLLDATYDTSIQLGQGITILAGNNNKPWTKLIDMKKIGFIIGLHKRNKIARTIPNQRFIVCNITPSPNNAPMQKNHFYHHFKQLTNHDILQIIHRFFTIKQQLEKEGQGVETDPISIIELLQHAKRIAQYNFPKEALHLISDSNIAQDAKNIIKNNLYYKQHNQHVISIYKNKNKNKNKNNKYVACDTKTNKMYTPDKLNVSRAITHSIIALNNYLIGNKSNNSSNSTNSFSKNKIKPYTKKEKKLINHLKAIGNIKNLKTALKKLVNFVDKHSKVLHDKYGYSNYENRANEDLLMVIELSDKSSKTKLKNDKKYWLLTNNTYNHEKIGWINSPKEALDNFSLRFKELNKLSHSKAIRDKINNRKIINYIKKGHCIVSVSDDLEPVKPLSQQIRKVSRKDLHYTIQNIIDSLRMKQRTIYMLKKWQKELSSYKKSAKQINNSIEKIRKKDNMISNEMNSLIYGVNDDLIFETGTTPWKKSDLTTNTNLIEFIDDLLDRLNLIKFINDSLDKLNS